MAILRIGGLSLLLTVLAFPGGCSSLKNSCDTRVPDSCTVVSATGAGNLAITAKAYQAGLGAGSNVIHFAADSVALSAPGITLLQRHAEFIKANPTATVRLEGHADEHGSPEYNLTLGKRRVREVATFLRATGVDDHQIREISHGHLLPLIDSDDETARAQNRRVKIVYR